jgi:hypothetical protein
LLLHRQQLHVCCCSLTAVMLLLPWQAAPVWPVRSSAC